MLGEHRGECRLEGRVVAAVPDEVGARRADAADRTQRCDVRSEEPDDVGDELSAARAHSVDLVDEDQRGQPKVPQDPHQYPGVRLDAFDRGQHEHRAVENAERPLDLGDEVAVARGVDEVDGAVTDGEPGDRGPDRDPSGPLDLAGVGMCGARLDAAEPVGGARIVEQPLGQAGLTGVDVRENPNVDDLHRQLGPRKLASGWVVSFRVLASPCSCPQPRFPSRSCSQPDHRRATEFRDDHPSAGVHAGVGVAEPAGQQGIVLEGGHPTLPHAADEIRVRSRVRRVLAVLTYLRTAAAR